MRAPCPFIRVSALSVCMCGTERAPSLLDEVTKRERWQEFLVHKKEKDDLSQKAVRELEDFILGERYADIAKGISDGTYVFSVPVKRQINKTKAGKKRDVYTYAKDEMMVLKMLSYLMHGYDHLFSPNLYSFRSGRGVKKALYDLKRIRGIDSMYGYKADISNYFNSVDTDRLLGKLGGALKDDRLHKLFADLLSDRRAMFRNELIAEDKGVMAGMPLSAFLANFYLKEMDDLFFEKGVAYLRYADDIIVFAASPDELNVHKETINSFLEENGLSVNGNKEFYYRPGDTFEYLGFSYTRGVIDLSENTVRKMKAKIRRASRSIRRWSHRKKASEDASLKAMIKKFDLKFFGKEEGELSWKYWFFPSVNTDVGLREVDAYMQERLRYLVTGRYNKKNYDRVPYERLKECGYRPLVHEFHAGGK